MQKSIFFNFPKLKTNIYVANYEFLLRIEIELR